MPDYTRGDDPVYNGFREGWKCPCDAKEETDRLWEITEGITLDRLQELVQAESEGRLVVLPYKRGDRIYVVDDKVKGSIRTTKANYYQIYAEEPIHVLVKCTANESWHELEDVFATRVEAIIGVEKMHQKKRDACLRWGRVCPDCKNSICKARAEAALARKEGKQDG